MPEGRPLESDAQKTAECRRCIESNGIWKDEHGARGHYYIHVYHYDDMMMRKDDAKTDGHWPTYKDLLFLAPGGSVMVDMYVVVSARPVLINYHDISLSADMFDAKKSS